MDTRSSPSILTPARTPRRGLALFHLSMRRRATAFHRGTHRRAIRFGSRNGPKSTIAGFARDSTTEALKPSTREPVPSRDRRMPNSVSEKPRPFYRAISTETSRRKTRLQQLRRLESPRSKRESYSFKSTLAKLSRENLTKPPQKGLSHYRRQSRPFPPSEKAEVSSGFGNDHTSRRFHVRKKFEKIEIETDKLSPWDTPRLI